MSRGADIIEAMRTLLLATDEFDDVLVGRPPDEYASAAIGRSCNISPVEDRTKAFWDQGDQVEVYTKVRITFTGCDADQQLADRAADRLYNVARNTLDDVSLASLTMPAFTGFESAKWLKPVPPSRQIEAIFSYRYFTDDNAFDVTE